MISFAVEHFNPLYASAATNGSRALVKPARSVQKAARDLPAIESIFEEQQ
jgi:hypothetical protein